jgi:hypothetical protein
MPPPVAAELRAIVLVLMVMSPWNRKIPPPRPVVELSTTLVRLSVEVPRAWEIPPPTLPATVLFVRVSVPPSFTRLRPVFCPTVVVVITSVWLLWLKIPPPVLLAIVLAQL